MKKNINFILLLAGATMMALAACDKEIDWNAETRTTEGQAFVKVIHASPNFGTIMGARDSFNFYFAGTKVSGPFLTYNAGFPAAATTAASYIAVPAGLQLMKFTVNGLTTPDSIQFHTFDKVLQPGKYYSLIITDSIKSTNPRSQMWIEDAFTRPVPGEYSIRFVNTVWNEPTNVDLFSTRQNANLFTNVAKGAYTGFINKPAAGSDTLIVRSTGTTTELARLNTVALSGTRVYTVVYRGNATLTTGTKVRGLTVFRNY